VGMVKTFEQTVTAVRR